MFLFDLFTFKSKLSSIFNSDLVKVILEYIRQLIILYSSDNELSGAQKKQRVDEFVIQFIQQKCNSSNSIINFFVSILISNVPAITQCIYDYLKSFVVGLTSVDEGSGGLN